MNGNFFFNSEEIKSSIVMKTASNSPLERFGRVGRVWATIHLLLTQWFSGYPNRTAV